MLLSSIDHSKDKQNFSTPVGNCLESQGGGGGIVEVEGTISVFCQGLFAGFILGPPGTFLAWSWRMGPLVWGGGAFCACKSNKIGGADWFVGLMGKSGLDVPSPKKRWRGSAWSEREKENKKEWLLVDPGYHCGKREVVLRAKLVKLSELVGGRWLELPLEYELLIFVAGGWYDYQGPNLKVE